jgi:hypothetical protein
MTPSGTLVSNDHPHYGEPPVPADRSRTPHWQRLAGWKLSSPSRTRPFLNGPPGDTVSQPVLECGDIANRLVQGAGNAHAAEIFSYPFGLLRDA